MFQWIEREKRVIVTDLTRLRKQIVLTPNLEKAITYLISHGQSDLPTGRQVVDGDKVYVEVQRYETIEGPYDTFEGHRAYIDIQYVVEGEEVIGWASINDVVEKEPFDTENDYWLATAPRESVTDVRLHSGQLAVLYPDDMHAPRRAAGKASLVRKLVVKVAID